MRLISLFSSTSSTVYESDENPGDSSFDLNSKLAKCDDLDYTCSGLEQYMLTFGSESKSNTIKLITTSLVKYKTIKIIVYFNSLT